MGRFIGIMSGTSLDGIDCVLCELDTEGKPQVLAHHTHPFQNKLQQELRSLCQPGDNEIERMGPADRWLGMEYAAAVHELLAKANCAADDITAIGVSSPIEPTAS